MKSKYTVILLSTYVIFPRIENNGVLLTEIHCLTRYQKKRLTRKIVEELYKKPMKLGGISRRYTGHKTIEDYVKSWEDMIIKVYEVD